MRECGECTLCCKVMQVVELDKPAGSWCSECDVGKGCTIYETRPKSCREFNCLWLMDEHWPEDTRPDKSHVVMSTATGKRLVAHVDPDYPDAHDQGPIAALLDQAVAVIDVIIVCGQTRKIRTTAERVADARRILHRFI